ncbi:hypothetical protein [Deinococcus apachensis]|uniref:hypothetical protein n=1 Tax=Deinococcus apachensis TaxID=309886 RepID=UPI00035CDFF2|nr:hypothetical protein [Deinococcus apachensis]
MRATPWPPPARTRLVLAALLLGTASAQSAPLVAQQVLGRAEVLEDIAWRAISGPTPVRQGLRTGAGRVWLASSGGGRSGTVLVGPESRLRAYRDEADLQGGQFLLRGPVGAHVLGNHLVLEGGAQARVDLGTNGTPRRVALLAGNGRLAVAGRVVSLNAGRQVALGSGVVSAFAETDPWYAAQFTGVGRVTVQATRGPVYVGGDAGRQIARIGTALGTGNRLITGDNAWAEVGYAGGGYLRLQEGGELDVLGTERTVLGHEVTLGLTRGSVLNVVQGGGPGTPLANSAVRGSLFRVGAARLAQTFGDPGVIASAGPARTTTPSRPPVPATPAGSSLTLQLDPVPGALRDLTLGVSSLPGARVVAQVGTRSFPLTPVGGKPGRFRLDRAALAEGPHTVQVRAEWRGQLRTRLLKVTIDRTPPTLGNLRAERAGRVLLLSGSVREAGAGRVDLTANLGGESFRQSVTLAGGTGTFRLTLPAPAPGTPVRVTVRDEAGNEAHAVPS